MSAKAAAHRAVAGMRGIEEMMVVVVTLEVLSGLLLVLGCRSWSTA
jgi:hypothetical protein